MFKKELSAKTRIVLMVVTDLLLLGIALCTFAFFHHVYQPKVEPVTLPTPKASATPAVTATPTTTPETSPGETPTPTPEPNGLLRGKYADKFSQSGVVQDEMSYRSANVALELTEERRYDSLVHVIDVYIQDISSFRTTVPYEEFNAKNSYLTKINELLPNAIALTSSDQFRNRYQSDWGFIVSNGYLYANKTNLYDICVLYLDGVLEVYRKGEANFEEMAERGIHQAWTFGPVLVRDGAMVGSFEGSTARALGKNPRMAIGYFEPGHYCLVMVDGTRGSDSGSAGAEMDELAELMVSLGCTSAYNLDGGDTAAIVFGGRELNTPTRTVTNAIYICEPVS